MILPPIFARMKQACHFVRVRVRARQVRPLVQIALVTSPRQILQFIRAPVLSRDHMFDVKRVEWIVGLAQPALFTPVLRPLPHPLADLRVHQAAGCWRSNTRALACRMAIRLPTWT